MTDPLDPIERLSRQLEALLQKQEAFSREVREVRAEIDRLKSIGATAPSTPSPAASTPSPAPEAAPKPTPPPAPKPQPAQVAPPPRQQPKAKTNLEKFIGENLINKIGIVITVLGVSIGAKYAIDHDLISPLTRIVLGYLAGLGLLGFALKLKPKYENFSAVLLSGAMAILYLITYLGYSLYELFPQAAAFALMVLFTVFTVFAALHYNRQIIAHLGLVGAYAVPFLLSNNSGQVEILFSYVAIINAGILAIALKKYWKPLYYAAFGVTWLIYASWFVFSLDPEQRFGTALGFLLLFFILFYLTFLAYKLVRNEAFGITDILLLLGNSFIFYGFGYALLANQPGWGSYLGAFTLLNAILHFGVSVVIYRKQLADRNLFFLVSGLVLVFITLAIPVQLDGNWVTLLWAGEAALLFWIGRSRGMPVYETLSYPLMALAFLSLAQDWVMGYGGYLPDVPESRITPLLNISFLTSVLVAAAFGFITWLDTQSQYTPPPFPKGLRKLISIAIAATLLLTTYLAFRLEIAQYWAQRYADSALTIPPTGMDAPQYYHNYDLKGFKSLWVIHYSLLFFSLLAWFNLKKIRNRLLGGINLGLLVLGLLVFLTQGLYEISELRESYLEMSLAEYYPRGMGHLLIRYVSLAFAALALYAAFYHIRDWFSQPLLQKAFGLFLHLVILWVASSELIGWLDLSGHSQSYKLGLSILWGTYALLLIALGIWKRKKYLRIGAIVLFGLTLVKLFLYDISHLNTLSKTVVFVSLGILLLIISFLYNKYKHLISDEGPS
ncbi:DUF2339 domain-containing protein [Robiginitalea sp. M366]|uniref:DUF2339 domain-containing protein n=1 Tax=Robiginitalea aestuariiviva TaxID=3036903 RepID=UPI00240D7249|nr:DUF2339 domain-containing protein [Robiginitalea aestuariiviva]MDG1571940.1 DUF2339 domain-containing protein [Robiginitalea aestuariiviva]